MFTAANEDGGFILLSGWLAPTAVWSVDAKGELADTRLTPKPPIDVGPYESQRFFATAKDGVKIPYSLVYRKGLKLDGNAPAFVSAYGSPCADGAAGLICRSGVRCRLVEPVALRCGTKRLRRRTGVGRDPGRIR